MRKIIVFFIVFVLLLFSFIFKEEKKETFINDIILQEEVQEQKILKVSYQNKVIDMNFEDYVIGVVACEVPASFNIEAIKSMAVAARTFALYKISTNKNYIMKTSTSDQCYISKEQMKKNWKDNYEENYNKIRNAVLDTASEYMTYNGEVIISFYFSISNGYTENCEDVFVQKLGYLRSVESSWDSKYNYKEKEVKFKVKDFLNKLNISEKKINNISVSRLDTNRVNKIVVNGKKFKGTNFRSLLSLRSTDFEINYDDNYVYIKTKGNGHGVGMSQYGANAMAAMGYTYDEILKYYYTGIKIMNNY